MAFARLRHGAREQAVFAGGVDGNVRVGFGSVGAIIVVVVGGVGVGVVVVDAIVSVGVTDIIGVILCVSVIILFMSSLLPWSLSLVSSALLFSSTPVV